MLQNACRIRRCASDCIHLNGLLPQCGNGAYLPHAGVCRPFGRRQLLLDSFTLLDILSKGDQLWNIDFWAPAAWKFPP
jgi:hypothetical protein